MKDMSRKGKGNPPEGQDLTPDELAELEGYEASRDAAAGAEPESRAARLAKLFYETPDGRQLRETVQSINNELDEEDTVSVQLQVPRQFMRLIEFLEGKRAANAGVAPSPADRVLNQLVLNELHDQLHWLSVAPARFAHYRALWNRFCDEQGAPEEKIGDAPEARASGGEEGPF